MPIPNLISPVDVVVQPLDKAATNYNARTRSPVKIVKRSTAVTISAQVVYQKYKEASVDSSGLIQTSEGYIIVRKDDADSLSLSLKNGDKISKIGSLDVQFFITKIEFSAFYDGDYTLIVAEFDSRHSRSGN